MASNTFYKMGSEALETFGLALFAQVDGDTPYQIPAGQLTALSGANTALGAAINAAQEAENAYHAAIAAKETARQNLVSAISAVAGTIYANSALTDAEIAATGLAVHDTTRSPVPVYSVTNATIAAAADGTAILEWDRNGNAYGVLFEVESSTNGTTWTLWTSTKRRRITLSGVTPGVTRWFRVRATTSSSASAWCVPVAAYGPEESVQLQLAA